MESNILNPKYKELKAIEMYRNNYTGMDYHKEHRNNWKKSLISIFAIAVLLTSVGVPVYGGIMAMENNAIPYEFGNIGSQLQASTSSITDTGHMGDIIYFEMMHFGAKPSVANLAKTISSDFADLGLTYITADWGEVAEAILVSGILEDSAVATILLGLIADPVGWSLLLTIAGMIIGY